MTELDTAVDTATVPAADLTTAVRYQTLVPLPVRTSNLPQYHWCEERICKGGSVTEEMLVRDTLRQKQRYSCGILTVTA